ncbi:MULTISPECIES: LCP family protein [unclassified Blastococcus]
MTAQHAPDAGQDLPGRRPARSGFRHRFRRIAFLLLAGLLVALTVDVVLVGSRIDRVDVDLSDGPRDADGRTWVLVGLDSRAHLPAGATTAEFGSAEDVPGSRADVVVVVHQTDTETTAVSVPRDLLVKAGERPGRLAMAWLDGPEALVDGLCGLGIPTDHLVTVDLAGFTATVDAVGGLTFDVPRAVRDPAAGLLLESTGEVHVDGATALALVRSRHPEHLVDDRWVPATVDPDGRAGAAGTVLSSLLDRARASGLHPWRLQTLAWTAADAIAVDPGTSVVDLIALARSEVGAVPILPASDPVGPALLRLPTAETAAAVVAAGLSCDR